MIWNWTENCPNSSKPAPKSACKASRSLKPWNIFFPGATEAAQHTQPVCPTLKERKIYCNNKTLVWFLSYWHSDGTPNRETLSGQHTRLNLEAQLLPGRTFPFWFSFFFRIWKDQTLLLELYINGTAVFLFKKRLVEIPTFSTVIFSKLGFERSRRSWSSNPAT